jgi:hypothetical protein
VFFNPPQNGRVRRNHLLDLFEKISDLTTGQKLFGDRLFQSFSHPFTQGVVNVRGESFHHVRIWMSGPYVVDAIDQFSNVSQAFPALADQKGAKITAGYLCLAGLYGPIHDSLFVFFPKEDGHAMSPVAQETDGVIKRTESADVMQAE